MQSAISKKVKKTCSIMLIFMIVFGIVLGNTPFNMQMVNAEESDISGVEVLENDIEKIDSEEIDSQENENLENANEEIGTQDNDGVEDDNQDTNILENVTPEAEDHENSSQESADQEVDDQTGDDLEFDNQENNNQKINNLKTDSQEIELQAVGTKIDYDFKKLGLEYPTNPGTYQETQKGWSLVTQYYVKAVAQSYGVKFEASSAGGYAILNFDVPSEGWYMVRLQGYRHKNGAIGGISIDNNKIGQYDFYRSDGEGIGNLVDIKAVYLTQGTHQLKLSVDQKGGYFYLFPALFQLEKIKTPPKLETVTVSSTKTELLAGQTAQLAVNGVMDDGSAANLEGDSVTINYTSSYENVATVDNNGIVKAIAPGSAIITASVTMDGVTKEDDIEIIVLDKALGSISVEAEKTALFKGETVQLVVSALLTDSSPVNMDEAEITYQSSNENIVSVSGTGLLTAISIGDTNITVSVKLGNVTLEKVLNVIVKDSALSSIIISSEKTELLLGEKVQLNLTGVLSDNTTLEITEKNADISFNSDNTEVATVSDTGLVTAIGLGTANITVTVQYGAVTKDAILIITVVEEITEEEIIYSFHKLGLPIDYGDGGQQETQENWKILGASEGLSYITRPFGLSVNAEKLNSYIDLEFYAPQTSPYQIKLSGIRSRAGGIVTIYIDGKAIGTVNFSADALTEEYMNEIGYAHLTQGTHTLTLKSTAKGEYGSKWYYMYPSLFILNKIQMIPELSTVKLSADKTEMILGQTAKLTVDALMNTGAPADLAGNNAIIAYTSDNETVATVSQEGIVTPVATGTANITVTVKLDEVEKQDTIAIKVLDETLAEVIVTAEKTTIPQDSQIQLSVSGKTTGGKTIDVSDGEIIFTSKNTEIAEVDQNGVVKALATGKVTIKVDVTLGSTTKSGEIELTISDPLLSKVTLISNKAQVVLGRKTKVTVIGELSNGKPADLTKEGISIIYESLNEDIATVSEDGTVTAIKEGTATIKAVVKSGDISLETTVNISVVDPSKIENSKTRATYYTEEKVAAARENVKKYDWAKSLRDAAVKEADKYLAVGGELNDEFLWNLVTPQSIPRTMFHIQRTKAGELGCPVCGKDITPYGSYPFKVDPINEPWKITCPSCNTKFPTNDFGAYYESGLDEHGIFNPELADKSLLKNTLYPEKGETWGVDDGYGWKNGNDVWTFIAYYNHWALWYQSGIIHKAIVAFRDAYLYTGDLKYAHAGIILLDRIADVYPDMDITDYLWDEGFDNGQPSWHTCQGKVLNDIWETIIVTDFVSAYDAFFPALNDSDPAGVVPFLSEKADKYGLGILKYSTKGIKKNIEDNILRQVLPGVQNSQIRGNNGMHQAALAMAAVVLDEEGTTQEMLDFNFKSGGLERINDSKYPNGRHFIVTGGNILSLLVDDVDRDGAGNEAAPGYNQIWIDQMLQVADILDGYDRYPEADLYKNVKFRKMFQSHYQLIMIGNYIPSIGDSGGTGNAGITLDKNMFVKAFEKFGDYEYAQVAYMLNGNSIYGIHGDIFSPNPEKVAEEIQAVIETYGTLDLGSRNMTGYGLATLRDGKDYTKRVGYSFDFLEMPIADSSGKEYKQVAGPSLFYRSAGEGDYITLKFTVTESDEYNVGLITMKASLYGKYIVKIDGKQIGDEFDPYSETLVESDIMDFGKVYLEAGEHTITLECVGKNEASTNYVIGLRYLILENKDAEEARKINEIYGNRQRDVWMYYGRTSGHGHRDALNLGIHAFGMDLAPDLGYPEYTGEDPKRLQWISNTISHNTVVVDKSKQDVIWVGTPKHFDETELVSLMDVDASGAYPQTDMYRRTTAMIKVDDANSYIVDFFRIIGGEDHHFSFHSNNATVTVDGLNLTTQETGTYAGPDVNFGVRPANDSVDGTYYKGPGFHYLRNVEKDDNPSSIFSVDWKQVEDPRVHLRLTMLGELDSVALAIGEPPLNNANNPRELKYMIAHRTAKDGKELDSTFVSVIEPYKENRYIESISPVTLRKDGVLVEGNDAKAVKVVLTNGRVDYIVYSLDKDAVYTVDDKFEFSGFFGVYSEADGKQIVGYINDGTTIGKQIKDAKARLTGTVTGFTETLEINNEITVQMDTDDFNSKDLIGRYIYVENDGVRNAAYQIKGIKLKDGNKVVLDIGDATLIRKWADPQDFSKGFVYDIAKGANFVIPLSSYEEKLFEVKNIKFTNLQGEEVNSLTDGAEIRASAEIVNNTGNDVPVVIIIALYDKYDRIVNFSTASQNIGTNSVTLEAGFRLPGKIDGHRIKVFIWDSWDGMRPLTNAVEFPQK